MMGNVRATMDTLPAACRRPETPAALKLRTLEERLTQLQATYRDLHARRGEARERLRILETFAAEAEERLPFVERIRDLAAMRQVEPGDFHLAALERARVDVDAARADLEWLDAQEGPLHARIRTLGPLVSACRRYMERQGECG
jgi:hypothetical protein